MTIGTVVETDSAIECTLYYRKLHAPVDLPALSETFAALKSSSILGGNSAKAHSGRFSYWAAESREVFELRAGQKNPFEKLYRHLTKYKLASNAMRNTHDAIRNTSTRHGFTQLALSMSNGNGHNM